MFDKYSEHSSASPTITPRFQHKTRFWRIYNKFSIISAINQLQNWVSLYFANRSNFVSNNTKMKLFQTKLTETTGGEAWQICALPYLSSWGTLLEEGKNSTLKAQQCEKRPQLRWFWMGSRGTGSAMVHSFTNTLPALFTLCWSSFIFPSLQQKKILSLHGQLESASTGEKESQKQQLFQWTAVLYSEGFRQLLCWQTLLKGKRNSE